MSEFDNSVLQQEQDRMARLQAENQCSQNQQSQQNIQIQQLANEVQYLRNQVHHPPTQRRRLNLPSPPKFLGIPFEL